MTRDFTSAERTKIEESLHQSLTGKEYDLVCAVIGIAENYGILKMNPASLFSLDEFPGFMTTRLAGGRNTHLKKSKLSERTLCNTVLAKKRQVLADGAPLCAPCAKAAKEKTKK